LSFFSCFIVGPGSILIIGFDLRLSNSQSTHMRRSYEVYINFTNIILYIVYNETFKKI
jgi:hypothetical protein